MDGVLRASGHLEPGPGVPGFIEFALLLDAHDAPCDLSAYDGVCVRIKVIEGPVALKLLPTTLITNGASLTAA